MAVHLFMGVHVTKCTKASVTNTSRAGLNKFTLSFVREPQTAHPFLWNLLGSHMRSVQLWHVQLIHIQLIIHCSHVELYGSPNPWRSVTVYRVDACESNHGTYCNLCPHEMEKLDIYPRKLLMIPPPDPQSTTLTQAVMVPPLAPHVSGMVIQA